jgi:hypothetical protein
MLRSAIATAESRAMRSRADFSHRLHRLGLALAHPAPLAGAAVAGLVVGFAAVRLRPNTPGRALAAILRQGVMRYVRHRTAKPGAPAENAGHA